MRARRRRGRITASDRYRDQDELARPRDVEVELEHVIDARVARLRAAVSACVIQRDRAWCAPEIVAEQHAEGGASGRKAHGRASSRFGPRHAGSQDRTDDGRSPQTRWTAIYSSRWLKTLDTKSS